MPIASTLLDMRIDATVQAGIEIDAIGGTIPRHTLVNVNRTLNQTHRALRAFVTALHYQLYKLASAHQPLPVVAAVTGEDYAHVDWPTDMLDLLGVDAASSSTAGDWRRLEPVEWEERRSFNQRPYAIEGYQAPYAFSAITSATITTSTTLAVGKIALFPIPRGGLYKLWYLPHWVDITNDTHIFVLHDEDWRQWMIWDFCRRIATRDGADKAVLLAEANRQLDPVGPDGKPNPATVAGRIVKSAPRHVKAGPKTWQRAENY